MQTEYNNNLDLSNESGRDKDGSMLYEQHLQMEEGAFQNSEVEIDSGDNEDSDDKSDDKKNKDVWRIWLSPEEESSDPLISIWKWSGTMGKIHLEWIKNWLESKLHK